MTDATFVLESPTRPISFDGLSAVARGQLRASNTMRTAVTSATDSELEAMIFRASDGSLHAIERWDVTRRGRVHYDAWAYAGHVFIHVHDDADVLAFTGEGGGLEQPGHDWDLGLLEVLQSAIEDAGRAHPHSTLAVCLGMDGVDPRR